MIRDSLAGERYKTKILCLDIVGFTTSRLVAMRDLRRLLHVDLATAKSILDNLPYHLCETPHEEECLEHLRAAQQCGFATNESSYIKEKTA